VPITTRLYSPTQLGHINLFNTMASLCLYFVLFGLDQSFFRYYHEPPGSITVKRLFTHCINLTAIIFILFLGVSLFYKDYIISFISEDKLSFVYLLLCVNVLAMTIIRYSSISYLLEQNALYYSIQSLLILAASKLLIIIVGLFKPDYYWALVSMNFSLVIITSYYLFKLIKEKYDFFNIKFDFEVTKEIARYAIPLMPLTLIAWFNQSVSNIILRKNLGFEEVGIFSSGVAVASLISIVQIGFNTYWGTYVYANYKTENYRIKMVNRYITFLLVAFAIVIMMFQDVIYMIIGPKYIGSKLFFAFLIVTPICLTISDTTGLGIDISKKSYLHLISTSLSAFSNLLFCLLLLPLIGLTGAAIASAIAGIIMLITRTVIGERYYKCVQSYNILIMSIIVLILSSTISFVLNNNFLLRISLLLPLLLLMLFVHKKEAVKLITDVKGIILNAYAERMLSNGWYRKA